MEVRNLKIHQPFLLLKEVYGGDGRRNLKINQPFLLRKEVSGGVKFENRFLLKELYGGVKFQNTTFSFA